MPAHGAEKLWVTIAFVWCMVLFAMMPLWHLGRAEPLRHPPRGRADRATTQRVQQFVDAVQGRRGSGIPSSRRRPAATSTCSAQMWQWYPVLKLQKGVEYTLHLSSLDVNHGFSLYPVNINFQVVPGYDYGLRVMPNKAGDFRIVCNEFCGIGHHIMVGKVVVDRRPRAPCLPRRGGAQ